MPQREFEPVAGFKVRGDINLNCVGSGGVIGEDLLEEVEFGTNPEMHP